MISKLGIDMGSSTVKLALLQDDRICATWLAPHFGRPFDCLQTGLQALGLSPDIYFQVAVTGSNAEALVKASDGALAYLGDIPAVVEGVRMLCPQAGSAIEIGSQSARFITDLQQPSPQFATNEHCAGGTGSFFEDQMSRLGLQIEEYSTLVGEATTVPRLSGRCAVFAKTDIIHRQQEGVSTPDILLGLCYAMIRNYKATIVRNLPVLRPVAFCGGVTCNGGVLQAIRDIFGLTDTELLVPRHARYAAALGAAIKADGQYRLGALLALADRCKVQRRLESTLPALQLRNGTCLQDPVPSGVIPPEGCALGIDVGSTSTDLVLVSREGELIDFQYLRTAGNPEQAVRNGLDSIQKRFGEVRFTAVGVTGSGRERIARLIGADVTRDEITAQAKGATYWVPEADTVFEIGGQDSKYISLKNGAVVDFQMNKICAAGTGSFVEEQASRMHIPLAEFGPLALQAEKPAALGERCTVFIETAIASAAAEGVGQGEIAAGLCHAIVRNYLHKVVGSKPVGKHIVLQGGVAYNPGIVAAFQSLYGTRIHVSPCFSISGAFGAALLAQECASDAPSTFCGFDAAPVQKQTSAQDAQAARNIAFYHQADQALLDGYTGTINPKKKTVGVPYVLMIHKFFPLANAFFTSLGFNVVLTKPTDEETIRLSQQTAQGETCYPVKLIYGHMMQLMEQRVDYIFLPTIHTMKHETSHVEHNYGCVYMQTAPESVAKALDLQGKGITLLSPVFDLDFGKEAMASAMLSLGKVLGVPKPFCAKALLAGAMAVRKHDAFVEKQGRALLDTLKPDDKVLVLITRNYGVSDPILNMGIPDLLLKKGYKVITLNHLPGHSLDISAEYDNLYWPFGQHILSGAKLIAHHPNLYAVYLTNHGCGPDSMLSQLFRNEMGDKPYLQIEVDEHFSKVGVITRVEAFLNSLSQRPTAALPKDFALQQVTIRDTPLSPRVEVSAPLWLPDMGAYTLCLVHYFRSLGVDAHALPPLDDHAMELGRAETVSKEYLPFAALLGSILAYCEQGDDSAQFFVPQTLGAEADGMYARVIRAVLDRHGLTQTTLVSPVLESLPLENAENRTLLFRALLAGDVLYAAPPSLRAEMCSELQAVPTWEELEALARRVSANRSTGLRIAAVGTPLCLTVLNDNVVHTLEQEENTVLRAPLSEALWFLWKDHCSDGALQGWLEEMASHMMRLGSALGTHSAFALHPESLFVDADAALPHFDGGNGRYRYAKAVDMGRQADAVLTLAPRYENTSMILDMRMLRKACSAPLYQLLFDRDWDEAAWSRLRSFLYYCHKQENGM